MKQIVQDLVSGDTTLFEVPVPQVRRGGLLVRSTASLLSAGTERMLLEFGQAGWLEKARKQPERVRQVLDKMRVDGVVQTIDTVRSKLEQPIPLGYCNSGIVEEVGPGVRGYSVGDRVASNGPHAEYVFAPVNLAARVPDGVEDDAAAFTVMGAIGLQGVRLAAPTLGECFVVTGLGLIGLVTVQLLRAQGCRVLGIDFDETKLELARQFGAETVNGASGDDVLAAAREFSRGRGVDGVLVTAATKSNEPVSHAAKMCRKRGRIVLVGVAGLDLDRGDFFEKEITFQVSCSYGPGRYDPSYELDGQDYPVGFVRWTEQRNFEAVLDMMETGRLNVQPLISHRFAFSSAGQAYDLLASGSEPYLGILLEYGREASGSERTITITSPQQAAPSGASIGVIGAGNYAGRVLIPAFEKAGAGLHSVTNTGGVGGAHYARKHGFSVISTDPSEVIASPDVDAVVIATRHDTHGRLVKEALAAGKDVFCEKPLALTLEELDDIRDALSAAGGADPRLMVGFNRRFSPLTVTMKRLLDGVSSPKAFVMTVNAGAIPEDHWTQDPEIGGGRIIGEACHFVDLLRHLAGHSIVDHSRISLDVRTGDSASIGLEFADGSIGSIHYLANGHRSVPKERLEVFVDGRVLHLDNFRRLKAYGWTGFNGQRLRKQDKGQEACARAFVEAMGGGKASPISFEELYEVSRASIELAVG